MSAFLYLFECLRGGVDLFFNLFLEFPPLFCKAIVAFGVFCGVKLTRKDNGITLFNKTNPYYSIYINS